MVIVGYVTGVCFEFQSLLSLTRVCSKECGDE